MNAIAQGGDQCVDEFDMTGQHARTHGSTCAPPEGFHAEFNLKNYNSNVSFSTSGIFSHVRVNKALSH